MQAKYNPLECSRKLLQIEKVKQASKIDMVLADARDHC